MTAPISPTPFQPPSTSAEQNLFELTKEMITHTAELKKALEKNAQLPKDPQQLQDFADTVIALDQASQKARRIS